MVKSSQPPDVSCTLAAWPPLQDFSNQSTLSKSNVQNKPWVVSTLSWTEREVTSSLKNRPQEPQCSRSRPTCQSTNPSVSSYNILFDHLTNICSGFDSELRAATSGQAFPQCCFDHWQTIVQDPLEEGNIAHKIVTATRKRKGLSEELPPLDRFLDKL